MSRAVSVPLFLLLTVIVFAQPSTATDPCDFVSSGALVFPYEQVVACYESVPFAHDDLENILAVIAQHRSFSDLGELYDAQSGWMANLAALDDPTTEEDYPDDFAMHNAIKAEHKNQLNGHVRYTPPACYWAMLNAFVPFDFGVTTRFLKPHEDQIVFIEDAPFLAGLYGLATGIDARELVGMKVVAINGTPALEHFRTFGREKLKIDASDSVHLNLILNGGAYGLRFSGEHDFLPERPADEYLLESRNGRRFRVTLPWVFVRRDILGIPALAPTASTEEFIDLCMQPSPSPASAEALEAVGRIWRQDRELDRERRRFVRRKVSGPRVTEKDFFEVPPGQVGKGIEVIIPFDGSSMVLQYKQNVTAIRLFNTVDWVDVARQGIEHACQNSDRLIIDLRLNGGGNDIVIRWLYQHLFPEEADLVEAGKIPFRWRNDSPELNEFLFKSALFESLFVPLGFPPCAVSLGPRCFLDLDTGDPLPLDELDWFLDPSVTEMRAGVPVSLTRLYGMSQHLAGVFPEPDASSCAGRFAGENLIFLTDGVNGSGGYFLPAAFKGKGVIVTMGGFVGEPIAMGNARTGATASAGWGLAAELMELISGGLVTFEEELLRFERDVNSNMEMWGAYRKDLATLHFYDPLEADLRLPVWSDSPATDGYVYGRLLEAVDAMTARRGPMRP